MQRPATRQSRGANADEKRHMQWIKERGLCAACWNNGGVIVHHCGGSAYKTKVDSITVLIGHAFVLGLCEICDSIVTRGSRRALENAFGRQSLLWEAQYVHSPVKFADEILRGIAQCGL